MSGYVGDGHMSDSPTGDMQTGAERPDPPTTNRVAGPSARVRPLGDRALIVNLPDLPTVSALRAALAESRPRGVVDVVPAARTLAVLVDQRAAVGTAHAWIERALAGLADTGGQRHAAMADLAGEVVTIDVVYDGDDLDEVAKLVGIPVDEVVRRHTSATWRVAFSGFAPGFGYLVTDDDWFEVPRLRVPRTVVPEGAVGLAGGFSGVYPRQGPGGWQLIGRTDAPLWRPREAHPALLGPGTVVRFRAVDALTSAADALTSAADGLMSAADGTIQLKSNDLPQANHDSGQAHRATSGIAFDAGDAVRDASDAVRDADAGGRRDADAAVSVTVVSAGMLLLIQDLGRPGSASIGAGRSGALDRGALRLGNRLVGNVEGAAGLEVAVGARLRFDRSTWFAVTGARGVLLLGGHPIEPDTAVRAGAGDVLELGTAERGLRYVVALRGGVAVPRELGSAATDVGARIGPDPLRDGDGIELGTETSGGIPAVDALTVWSPPDDEVDVHVVPGPRQEWFDPASVEEFYDVEWRVTQASNRVGMRLRSPDGVVLRRSRTVGPAAELASEPMVPGAVQVPPSGEPTVLLADGPVTGGYPVIAVVTDADLDLFAQLRPGQRLRFRHARSPLSDQ